MNDGRPPCVGVILAGGGASRLGGVAKGLERVQGERIVDRVATRLGRCTDRLILSANATDAAQWLPAAEVVRDGRPGAGAIGGLLAALERCGSAVLAMPWDMPFVPTTLLDALRATGEQQQWDAVVPTSDAPWGFEPLVGWFAPSCAPVLREQLARGEASAGAWLGQVRTERLVSAAHGPSERIFFNVNTPEDLLRAQWMIVEDS